MDRERRGWLATSVDRWHWMIGQVRPRWSTRQLAGPEGQVLAAVEQSLQHEFPSPHGHPVFKGVVRRSRPIRLRIRVFPHGARVGLMRVATRDRPIKPTLVGALSADGPGCTLTYAISSRTEVLLALGSGGLTIVLLAAAVVAALAASTTTAWVLLALAAFAGVIFADYLSGVDRAREEQVLLEGWAADRFGRPQAG
jgi:hypothetical protein